MAGFVQIVEFRTSRFDEGQKIVDEWRAKTEGKRSSVRAMMLQDREDPSHYYTIVEFASYEEAMRNSELPETQELSQKLAALTEGGQAFHNLDVVRVEEG